MVDQPEKKAEITKLMELWVASDLKVQVLVFFHDNPGVIETLDGLAARLGTTIEALREDIGGHIALGLIKERKVGTTSLLVFDREREGEVQDSIQAYFHALTAKGAAA